MGLRNRSSFKQFNCFFVTTSCHCSIPIIDLTNSYSLIERSLTFTSEKYKTDILAYVIMPNHIHLILYFREENKLSDFMRDFKKFTSVRMIKSIKERNQKQLLERIRSTKEGRKFQVWQDRFDDLYLESKWLIEQKLDYIHSNPLQEKWVLVQDETNYPYSSAKYYYEEQQPGIEVTHYGQYF